MNFLLKLKSNVPVVLKSFLQLVKTQFESNVKSFISDNGIEFFNSSCHDLFSIGSIVHQSSCVHTPQQNKVVERKHRQLLKVARAIRFQGSIPLRFWGLSVQNVAYMINRIPSSALVDKSPFEVFYGRKPNLQHLKVLGSLFYVTNVAKK